MPLQIIHSSQYHKFFVIIGYNSAAEEDPNGIKRTIVENRFMRLEIIIENTVVGGSLGLSMAPKTIPLLNDHHYECELHPFEVLHDVPYG